MTRQRNKRTFILGAGASVHAGGPLLADLMNPADEEQRDRLEKALGIVDRYGIPGRALDFEQLLTHIDLRLSAANRGTTEPHELEAARGLLAKYVHRRCAPLHATVATREFCKHLRGGDTVVAFNYDLLIEEALWGLGRWSFKGGYGIPEAYELQLFPRDAKLREDEEKLLKKEPTQLVRVLKPHGSVNFRGTLEAGKEGEDIRSRALGMIVVEKEHFCAQRQWVFIQTLMARTTPIQPGDDSLVENQMERDRDPEHMVLPSFLKNYANAIPFVRHAWHESYRAIRESAEIWLIGYSIPEADAHAHLLLSCCGADRPGRWRFRIADPNADLVKERLLRLVTLNPDSVEVATRKRFECCQSEWTDLL